MTFQGHPIAMQGEFDCAIELSICYFLLMLYSNIWPNGVIGPPYMVSY